MNEPQIRGAPSSKVAGGGRFEAPDDDRRRVAPGEGSAQSGLRPGCSRKLGVLTINRIFDQPFCDRACLPICRNDGRLELRSTGEERANLIQDKLLELLVSENTGTNR